MDDAKLKKITGKKGGGHKSKDNLVQEKIVEVERLAAEIINRTDWLQREFIRLTDKYDDDDD